MNRKAASMLLITLSIIMAIIPSHAYALTITEEAAPAILGDYLAAHPEIEVVPMIDDTEFIREALDHSDAIDVYFFHTLQSTIYETLRDKGFLLPLDDPELTEFAQSLYPELQSIITYNGEVCAIPFAMIIQPGMGVYIDTWEKCGFSEKDLPRTWGQLMRFAVEEWPRISDQYEGVGLFDEADYSYALLTQIGNNYEAWRARHDYGFGYDTPEFREILELFQQMNRAEYYGGNKDAQEYLFCCSYYPSVNKYGSNARSLQLSFKEGEGPCWATGVLVMAINPGSKHIDEAMELVRYVAQYLNVYDRMDMCPGENEPVIGDLYYESQAEYDAQMRLYSQKLEGAEDEVSYKEIELERDAYDLEMQAFLSENKYEASPESIQQYRQEVENTLTPIYRTGISREEYRAVNEKRRQFLDGQVSADQYIAELERRFVFSVMENR